MARIATGVSKKANRQNLAALDMVHAWRNQFGIKGFVMSPELAWAVTGGELGIAPVMLSAMPLIYAPESDATLDAIKVALHIIKKGVTA